MRRRILRVSLTAVALAVVVLGVPLGLAVSRVVSSEQHSELERAALRAAVAVSPDYVAGDPIELPRQPGMRIGVYDSHGRRVSGAGPGVLGSAAAHALTGRVVGADTGEQVIEAVPVSAGESVIAVVRAATPESAATGRVAAWLGSLTGLCLLAALCAGGYAAWVSQRLARPLTKLRRTAEELGDGNFTVRAAASGVAEIDAVGRSLNRTAERLASMIEHERSFAARASHQLRTPLTQLQLELESGLAEPEPRLRAAARSAMTTAEHLAQTIDDVLALGHSSEPGGGYQVEELLEDCRQHWQGPLAAANRPLHVLVEQPLFVGASLAASRQILHVLLDNALHHGQGTVTLRARDSHGAVAIDVADQGSAAPISLHQRGRMGLPLATTLALAQHGRLVVDQHGPGTRFTVLLPKQADQPCDGRSGPT